MEQPTNADLLSLIEELKRQLGGLQGQVNNIERLVDKATGMWILSKWVAAIIVGSAAFAAYIREWWPK